MAQYDKTIEHLVGVLPSPPSATLAPDSTGSMDQRSWDAYKNTADALATQILADPNARAAAIRCTPDGDGSACAASFVADFGARAYRRPLTPEETAALVDLYTRRVDITETGTFDEAVHVILRTIFLSPNFLTRLETSTTPAADGTSFALSGYEVASRLSYMLWGSMPDDALIAAAAAGTLGTPEGILAEARRMLDSEKAREKVSMFHADYAHMGEGTRWVGYQRDANYYPLFNESLIPTLTDESKAFFDYIFTSGGTFKDLVTSPVAFVNSSLAPIYGLNAADYGTALQQVTLDGAQRPGAFTRAGFLAAYSLFNRPSAILRGAFMQKHVLCRQIGAPPDGAEGTPLPTEGLQTNRERTDAQTAGIDCAGCHTGQSINPTGFAFESYDAIGAWQTTEKDTGAAINTVVEGVLIGATPTNVTGALDLMNAVANSAEAQRCYAQKWVDYSYQRVADPADACTVDRITYSMLTQPTYSVKNLVADLTQSLSFRTRALQTEVTP